MRAKHLRSFAFSMQGDGKRLRGVCVLLAAWLVLLAAQAAVVSLSLVLVPGPHLFRVHARSGYQWFVLDNEADGLYVEWDSRHLDHFAGVGIGWGPDAPLDWRAGSIWGWPGYVYDGGDDGWTVYRRLYVPRLPAACLLMLWPVVHWARRRRAKRLARAPGFPLAEPKTQAPPYAT